MKDIKKIISEIRDWLYRGINGYSIRDRSMDRIYRHYTGESSSPIYISPKWWGKIIAFFIKMNPLKKAGTFLIMIVMMIVVSLKDVINERLKSEISHLFEETIGPTLPKNSENNNPNNNAIEIPKTNEQPKNNSKNISIHEI